jgi:hypothetical protein
MRATFIGACVRSEEFDHCTRVYRSRVRMPASLRCQNQQNENQVDCFSSLSRMIAASASSHPSSHRNPSGYHHTDSNFAACREPAPKRWRPRRDRQVARPERYSHVCRLTHTDCVTNLVRLFHVQKFWREYSISLVVATQSSAVWIIWTRGCPRWSRRSWDTAFPKRVLTKKRRQRV